MPPTLDPSLDVCLGHVVHAVFVWALLAMYVPAAHGAQVVEDFRIPALQFFAEHKLVIVLLEFHVAVFHALTYP